MKNYRWLIACVMVVLMAVSVYSLVSTASNTQERVETLLAEAESLKEQGLYARAVEKYSEIIAVDPSIKYYNAVTDLYFDIGEVENSIAWGEETIALFPDDVSGYERLLRAYIENEKYSATFETIEIIDGRGLHSEAIDSYRSEVEYKFYLEYVAVDDANAPSGSYAAVKQNEMWGLISTQGKTFLKSQYTYAGDYANGYVSVCDREGIWYFVNSDGELAYNITFCVPGEIESVGLYNNNLFPLRVDGKYYYYNMDFQQCMGPFEYAGAFNYGVAAVKTGGSWLIIDAEGNQVGGETYEMIVTDSRGVCCMQERIVVKQNSEYYIVDSNGNKICSTHYEDAKAPSNGTMIAVKVAGKWGFADLDGNLIIEAQYDDAQSFSNGLAAVCLDNSWGFINSENNIVISAQFIECFSFGSSGTALVKNDRGWNILKLYSKNY